MNKSFLGARGEETAVRFLQSRGYRMILRNYRSRLGEIDIIARDGDTLCFIEVRSKNAPGFEPAESIDARKRRRIGRAAAQYLEENGLSEHPARFDVVCIRGGEGELIKNAFDLEED